MAFHSDKQRKAFFAKQGNLRSKVLPSISGRIKNIKEKLRQRQERLGKERIEKEKVSLKQEQEQVKRLQKEAKVEIQRERVTQQRIQAQQELRKVEAARRERTFIGKLGKRIKEREQQRKEFIQSPKGRALIKKQSIERRKTLIKVRKGLFG